MIPIMLGMADGARRTLHNDNKTIVFYSEKGEQGEECGLWASFVYLQKLAEDRRFRNRYKLGEMLQFNKFMDQKGDAAYDLISWRTISLLQAYCPEDRATILFLTGLNYSCSPWITKHFTDPFMIVQFVWTAAAVFEMQEVYVKELVGRIDLHCPSDQFRKTIRTNACAATNHILSHYIDKAQDDNIQQWCDLGLTNINNNEVEAVHSEERQGNLMKAGNDQSVNLSQHMQTLSRVQKIFDRRPMLTEAGVQIGRPKHTARAHAGTIDLGLPKGFNRADIEYNHHGQHPSRYQVPDSYDEFVALLQASREAGYKNGLSLYEEFIPEAVAQMKLKGVWRNSVHDRPIKKLPANKTAWLVHGPVSSMYTRLPDQVITAERWSVAMPKPKGKEDKFSKSVRAEMQENAGQEGDGSESDDAGGEVDAYLSSNVRDVIAKAKKDRSELQRFADMEAKVGGIKTEGGLVVGSEASGEALAYKRLLSGEYVLDEDGKLQALARVLRAFQIRDRHSRERGKRFWVGRLRFFHKAAQEGHDVTVGSCMVVTWGGSKSFAVVRVMGIINDKEKAYSVKLNRKSTTQVFKVELLDPVGPPTESKSQKYRGSGFCLPKLAAIKVIEIVELRHLNAIVGVREEIHDALLSIESILKLYTKGFSRVTKQEGHLHIENEAERLQNTDSGVMWNANQSELVCLFCVSSWYDETTGIIMKCKTCHKCYHQDCHTPKIPLEDTVDADSWECCVCSGVELDFCNHCREFWVVDGKENEKDNNRLMHCAGKCGLLWHQNCYPTRIKYEGDDVPWVCDKCLLESDQEAERQAEEDSAAAKRCPRVCKKTKKGAHKLQMAVDGKKVSNFKIADPRGSNLEEATWAQNYTHGGQAKPKRAPTVKTVFEVGAAIEAKWKGSYGYYCGQIDAVNENGTYQVEYEDGDFDAEVPAKHIRYPTD